eukprot:TRINITY_DN9778_c0_g1_i2.p1 TRINITY_DN9778_c0_g1~~TRINITY_DN9778_c0_g1_i2.p1  ORF type:complete len:365 (+),score=111.13 TRINITY_DN9778_c0_g1_i2:93-1187(+)
MVAEDFGEPPVATEVSTLFVVNIASDATHREVENMVRWFSGYEGVKIAGVRGKSGSAAMFVKFDSPSSATEAAKFMHGVPFDTSQPEALMKVEVARSDMKFPAAPSAARDKGAEKGGAFAWGGGKGGGGSFASYMPQPAPPAYPHPSKGEWKGGGRGGKGAHGGGGGGGGGVDTLAIIGAFEKGITEGELESFFAQLPGFLAYKVNNKLSGAFVKFESVQLAVDALNESQRAGIEAQFARSSMNFGMSKQPAVVGYGAKGGGAAWAPSRVSAYAGPPPAKRARPDLGSGVDTIVVQGIADKGYNVRDVEDFFRQVPGFLAWKNNQKIGGGFIKFESPDMAQNAISAAAEAGFEAKLARSSMNSS